MTTASERQLFGLVLNLASAVVGLKGAVSALAESQKSPDAIKKIQVELEYADMNINEFLRDMKILGVESDG